MISENHQNIHLGAKVLRLLEIKRIKQAELARALGIKQQSVSKLLHKSNIDPKKMKIIASVLHESVEDIIAFDEHLEMRIPHHQHPDSEKQKSVHDGEANDDYKTKYIQLLEEKIDNLKRMNG